MQLLGHDHERGVLRTLSSHTLLFTGPEGVGRRQVARWYASLLNCQADGSRPCGRCASCAALSGDLHPDYREISPKTTTSTGRVSRRPEILIAQLVPREGAEEEPLSRWLESPPTFKRRVGIIDRAETLNRSAANAFLKFLEEPPSHAVIILIAPSAEAVLPTIRSRSTLLRFGTVPTEEAHPLSRLGRVGDALRRRETPETFENIESAVRDYFQALPKGLEIALEAGDALEKLWSSSQSSEVAEYLLAYASEHLPEHYLAVAEASARFENALSAYASANLAVQVMTLDLRADMGLSI